MAERKSLQPHPPKKPLHTECRPGRAAVRRNRRDIAATYDFNTGVNHAIYSSSENISSLLFDKYKSNRIEKFVHCPDSANYNQTKHINFFTNNERARTAHCESIGLHSFVASGNINTEYEEEKSRSSSHSSSVGYRDMPTTRTLSLPGKQKYDTQRNYITHQLKSLSKNSSNDVFKFPQSLTPHSHNISSKERYLTYSQPGRTEAESHMGRKIKYNANISQTEPVALKTRKLRPATSVQRQIEKYKCNFSEDASSSGSVKAFESSNYLQKKINDARKAASSLVFEDDSLAHLWTFILSLDSPSGLKQHQNAADVRNELISKSNKQTLSFPEKSEKESIRSGEPHDVNSKYSEVIGDDDHYFTPQFSDEAKNYFMPSFADDNVQQNTKNVETTIPVSPHNDDEAKSSFCSQASIIFNNNPYKSVSCYEQLAPLGQEALIASVYRVVQRTPFLYRMWCLTPDSPEAADNFQHISAWKDTADKVPATDSDLYEQIRRRFAGEALTRTADSKDNYSLSELFDQHSAVNALNEKDQKRIVGREEILQLFRTIALDATLARGIQGDDEAYTKFHPNPKILNSILNSTSVITNEFVATDGIENSKLVSKVETEAKMNSARVMGCNPLQDLSLTSSNSSCSLNAGYVNESIAKIQSKAKSCVFSASTTNRHESSKNNLSSNNLFSYEQPISENTKTSVSDPALNQVAEFHKNEELNLHHLSSDIDEQNLHHHGTVSVQHDEINLQELDAKERERYALRAHRDRILRREQWRQEKEAEIKRNELLELRDRLY